MSSRSRERAPFPYGAHGAWQIDAMRKSLEKLERGEAQFPNL